MHIFDKIAKLKESIFSKPDKEYYAPYRYIESVHNESNSVLDRLRTIAKVKGFYKIPNKMREFEELYNILEKLEKHQSSDSPETIEELEKSIFSYEDRGFVFPGGYMESTHETSKSMLAAIKRIKKDKDFFNSKGKYFIFVGLLDHLKRIEHHQRTTKPREVVEVENPNSTYKKFDYVK